MKKALLAIAGVFALLVVLLVGFIVLNVQKTKRLKSSWDEEGKPGISFIEILSRYPNFNSFTLRPKSGDDCLTFFAKDGRLRGWFKPAPGETNSKQVTFSGFRELASQVSPTNTACDVVVVRYYTGFHTVTIKAHVDERWVILDGGVGTSAID